MTKKNLFFIVALILSLNTYAAEPDNDWWGQSGTWTRDVITNALICDATTNWGGANNWIATTFGTAGPWKDMTVKFDFYMPNSGNAIIWQFGQAGGDWANQGVKVQFNYYGVFAYNPSWAGGVTLLDANFGTSVHKYKLNGWNTAVINISATGVVSVKLNGVNGVATFTPADINTLSGDFCSVNYQYSVGNNFQMRNVEVTKGAINKKYFTCTPTAYTNMNMFSSTNAWFPVSVPEAVGPDNTTGGWYTVTTPGSEKIKYDGAITPTITGIRTEKAAATDEWWGTTIKFKAEVDAAGGNTTYKVGSNGVWNTRAGGGRCIMLNVNKYEIQILPEHEYGEVVQLWAWDNAVTPYAPYSSTGPFDFEIIISDAATHTITVKINGVSAPVNYNVAGAALNRLNANGPMYFEVYPAASPFVFSNVEMKKAGVSKYFFPNYTVPDAPTAVIGTAGNAQVSVTFTAPASNGGSAITGYTVTPYIGATAGTPVTQNANPITVSGLTNGTAYTFTVKANNAAGASAASAASTAVTPHATDNNITVSAATNITTLTLTPVSDIVVSSNTLNINASTTVNSVTVGNTGKLIVAAGQPLTVGTLTLTGALDGTTTSLKLDANVNASTVRLFKTIDKSKWYFMSFPYKVVVADITKSNGSPKPSLAGDAGELFIKYYDGGQRGSNGSGTSNWKHYEGAELIANKGYIFGLNNANAENEITLSFPLKTGGTLTAETGDRIINVAINNGPQANDRGWNLIGQPFLSKFIASHATGTYSIYVYDGVSNNFTPYTKDKVPNINPFSSYFIQASTELAGTGISFVSTSGRQLSPSVAANDLMDEVQLDFTSSTGSDYALLRMDNSLTTGYEIGMDFEKWIGTETAKPQIYTSLGGINYAFNALPMTNVVNLPVGIYTQTAGITTIHAAASKAPSLSKFLLTDNSTNPATVTDLLISDYTFTAAAGTDNSRFAITAQRVPTANVVETGANEPTLVINNSKLIINNLDSKASIRVFDAIGRMVANKLLYNNSLEINLSAKGMYTVQIEAGGKNWVKKIVN